MYVCMYTRVDKCNECHSQFSLLSSLEILGEDEDEGEEGGRFCMISELLVVGGD